MLVVNVYVGAPVSSPVEHAPLVQRLSPCFSGPGSNPTHSLAACLSLSLPPFLSLSQMRGIFWTKPPSSLRRSHSVLTKWWKWGTDTLFAQWPAFMSYLPGPQNEASEVNTTWDSYIYSELSGKEERWEGKENRRGEEVRKGKIKKQIKRGEEERKTGEEIREWNMNRGKWKKGFWPLKSYVRLIMCSYTGPISCCWCTWPPPACSSPSSAWWAHLLSQTNALSS